MKRILTLDTLKAKQVCASQLNLFASMFGQSVEVTEALCVEVSSKFDFDWASLNLLSSDALVEYERVKELARAEYERVRDLARAEYERVWDLAWAEYERVRDLAWAEHKRVVARAFARAYIAMQE